MNTCTRGPAHQGVPGKSPGRRPRLPLRSVGLAVGLILLILTTGACGSGNAASLTARSPEFAPRDQAVSTVAKDLAQPLVVDWPSADRGKLEVGRQRGLVVVRYVGHTMQVLDRCSVASSYGYRPVTRKKDRVQMRDADELHAALPLGGFGFEGELRNSGELDIDMTLVGRWVADNSSVKREELEGFCDAATHVVSAVTVGAFTFSSASDARVGGGVTISRAGSGGTSNARRATLTEDGDEHACIAATTTDSRPPEGCGAPIRVEVQSLAAAPKSPTCQAGSHWDKSQCVSDASPLLLLLLFAGM